MSLERETEANQQHQQVRIMEWGAKQEHQHQQHQQQEESNGVLYVKVMTDEQMEILRRQISVYATICEQLVEMHKSITNQHDLSGMKLGSLYCDPLMASSCHKLTSRQRWTPTPVQLQILEHIFDQGTGTPSKQKIKDITNELTQHGQISETNVYNWFQNRRARSKRKQLVGSGPNNAESEVETDGDSPKEKKAKSGSLRPDKMCFQSSEISSELHPSDPQADKGEPSFPSDGGSKSSGSLGHLSFYDSVMSNPRIDHLMGKMEVPANFIPYRQGEGYDMLG
ncbi:hypothetical protein GIB67_026814 [Kingdonia uniflora]|uniref:Homeobox domain-containing protein n=1 Tax=Kingdonia uniflora TaxID=39325 RepID=A0A7J7MI02_9MAGN|nr:hypothetical protein GIB67_026814 [Kingdonia uniflora]